MDKILPEAADMPSNDPHQDWCVFGWESGQVYLLDPPTQANAIAEAAWADECDGEDAPRVLHAAVPLGTGRLLRNAWAWGRFSEVERARLAAI